MSQFHLVQTGLSWHKPSDNRDHLEQKLASITGGVVVLPEMFTTGFSMASRMLAEPMDGETVHWMSRIAQRQNFTLCGSVIIEASGQYFNRCVIADTKGNVTHYDKRHLFRMADEHKHYSEGYANTTFKIDEFTAMPQVCYDLRFPVWSRHTPEQPYEVLIYVANWPASRREHWLTLLSARAIENQCYVVAVNRIGEDGNHVTYCGDSCVIDYRGDKLLDLADEDAIGSVNLELDPLVEYRSAFPAHLDSDQFSISQN